MAYSNQPPRIPWAVLAYTVSDDKGSDHDIDDEVCQELHAICSGANFDRVSVAAQVDFQNIRGTFRGSIASIDLGRGGFEDFTAQDNPLWQKILGGIDATRAQMHMQRNRSDVDSAFGGVLQEFFRFGRDECQPARQVVFFYGHAYGPMGMFYDRAGGQKNPHPMRLNDLASSIAVDGCHAEIVVFRDCFMSALETACQLRGAADFMIASQSVVPIRGVWPWQEAMAALREEASLDDVVGQVGQVLGAFLDVPENRHPFADTPISLLDVNATEALIEPMRAFVGALEGARADAARAARCAEAFEAARTGFPNDREHTGDPALIDVLTLTDALQQMAPDPVAAAAAAVGEVVAKRIVRWHHSQQGRYRGVNLYYKPSSKRLANRSFIESGDMSDVEKDQEAYKALAFNQQTGWSAIALNPFTPAPAAKA